MKIFANRNENENENENERWLSSMRKIVLANEIWANLSTGDRFIKQNINIIIS